MAAYWIIFVIGAFVAGLLIYYLYISRSKEEKYSDDTFFTNFMPQYSNGFSDGTILEVIQGTKRIGIKFMPKDVDYLKILKKKEKVVITPQLVWYEKNKLKDFPKHSWSAQKHKMWGLPPTPEDLPETLLKTEQGEFLAKMIEDASAENTVIEVLRNRTKVEDMILKRTEGKDRMAEHLKLDMNLNKDLAKKVLTFKEGKPMGSGIPPPN